MRRRLMGSTFLASKMFLRHPGDDDITNVIPDDKSGGGGGGDKNKTQQDDLPPEDDESIDSLFKKKGDDDDLATGDDPDDFNIEDESVDDTAIDQEYTAKGAELKTTIEGLLSGFVVKEDDIPDELGFSDKAQAARFMTGLQQRSVKQAMQIMNPVISHVMNLAVAKINNRLKSEVRSNGSKSAAKSEFDKLGFTDQADRAMALQFYQRGLATKMTPQKAAAATQKAMGLLGKSPKKPKSDGGGESGGRMLQGKDALDSMFS